MKIGFNTQSYFVDIRYEIEYLRAYINRIENGILEDIQNYKSKIKVVHEKEYGEGANSYYEYIEECEGIYSDDSDIERTFELYFPNLQRSSSLITLCNFFEGNLKILCERLSKEFNYPKFENRKSHLSFIELVIKYINDNKNLSISDVDYEQVNFIQKFRNRIVHYNGKLNEEIKEYVSSHPNLVIANSVEYGFDNIVYIKHGYLTYILDSYSCFFDLLKSKLV